MSRWSHFLLFGIISLGSLLILLVEHRQGEAALETTASVLDNLTHARLQMFEALLLAQRLSAGDPTASPTGPAAALTQALALLEDLEEGRSSLLGFRATPLSGSGLRELLATYRAELSNLREDMVSGQFFGRDPVEQQIMLAEVRDVAGALEPEVYARVRQYLADAERQHRFRLAVWVAILLAAAGAFVVVRRARDRAQLGRDLAESRLLALATHAEVGLARTDRQGRVVGTTDWLRRTFDVNPGEWVGSLWWLGLPPEECARVEGVWSDRARRGDAFSLEFHYAFSGARERWMSSRWTKVQGAAAGDGHWIGTFIDKTDQRHVEDQLRQAQKMEAVGRLSSGIAHDFNNLLAVIMANAELLREAPDGASETTEMVDEIAEAAGSGRDLVRNLMRFSREAPIEVREIDLGEVVRASGRLAQRLLPDRSKLVVKVPEAGPTVNADPRAVQQIVLNLVSNAGHAMPDGGQVTMEVDRVEIDEAHGDTHPWMERGRFGRIVVSDTGTGMDRATLEKIFEPFFTTKPEGAGTGLGLATVHGLVRQHGGHIHAYSQPGDGSTFRIYLPEAVASRTRGPEEPAPRESGAGSSGGPLRILVVDDSADLRQAAQKLLTRLGHKVSEAANGEDALTILEADQGVDLVISDVHMGEMTGIQLVETLRRRGDGRAVLLTSGHAVERLTDWRDVGYLPKPWTMEELREAIERAFWDQACAAGPGAESAADA